MTLRIPLPLVLLALAAPIWAAGDATADQQASALVRAMRHEAVIAAGLKYALLHNDRAAEMPQAVRDCLRDADLSFVHGMYVQAIQDALTPAEIATALDYYQSRAGYLELMLAARQVRNRLEGTPLLVEVDAAGDPNEAEMQRMREFAQSPLGRKIGQIETAEFKQRLRETGLEKLRAQCVKQP